MTKAYVIFHGTLTNPDRFMADYGSKVSATIEAFGGKYLVRIGEITYQEGKELGDINVVIEFPDMNAALSWKNSDQYQAIVRGRTENSQGTLMIIDGVSG